MTAGVGLDSTSASLVSPAITRPLVNKEAHHVVNLLRKCQSGRCNVCRNLGLGTECCESCSRLLSAFSSCPLSGWHFRSSFAFSLRFALVSSILVSWRSCACLQSGSMFWRLPYWRWKIRDSVMIYLFLPYFGSGRSNQIIFLYFFLSFDYIYIISHICEIIKIWRGFEFVRIIVPRRGAWVYFLFSFPSFLYILYHRFIK